MPDSSFWLHLLTQYGYAVVLAGTFLEGESILILAGILAHEGYFSLPLVALCALAGSLGSDQLMFFIGRRYGSAFLEKRPRLRRASVKIAGLVGRHETVLILGFRFIWGVRNATSAILGAQGVRPGKFFFLNAIGAAVWAVVFSAVGYGFGEVLEGLFGRLHERHHLALALLLGLALPGAAAAFVWNWRRKEPLAEGNSARRGPDGP